MWRWIFLVLKNLVIVIDKNVDSTKKLEHILEVVIHSLEDITWSYRHTVKFFRQNGLWTEAAEFILVP